MATFLATSPEAITFCSASRIDLLSAFHVSGFRCWAWGFGLQVFGLLVAVSGFGFRVSGFGFRVLGFRVASYGFGFGVSGLGS